jgi:hypothetical protein
VSLDPRHCVYNEVNTLEEVRGYIAEFMKTNARSCRPGGTAAEYVARTVELTSTIYSCFEHVYLL